MIVFYRNQWLSKVHVIYCNKIWRRSGCFVMRITLFHVKLLPVSLIFRAGTCYVNESCWCGILSLSQKSMFRQHFYNDKKLLYICYREEKKLLTYCFWSPSALIFMSSVHNRWANIFERDLNARWEYFQWCLNHSSFMDIFVWRFRNVTVVRTVYYNIYNLDYLHAS